jgi:hypothetical protein
MAEESNEGIAYLKALKQPDNPTAAIQPGRAFRRSVLIRAALKRTLADPLRLQKSGVAIATSAKAAPNCGRRIARNRLGYLQVRR